MSFILYHDLTTISLRIFPVFEW